MTKWSKCSGRSKVSGVEWSGVKWSGVVEVWSEECLLRIVRGAVVRCVSYVVGYGVVCYCVLCAVCCVLRVVFGQHKMYGHCDSYHRIFS